MFSIRKDQRDLLADEDFVWRLCDLITEEMDSPVPLPSERLRLIARHGLDVARGYGFVTERDIVNFILNMLTINPAFHLQPRIQRILRDSTLPISTRSERLLTDVDDAEWEEAGRMSDPAAYWSKVLRLPS